MGGGSAAAAWWWREQRGDTKRVNRESTCKQATRETNNVGAAGCSPNEAARLSPVRTFVRSCVLFGWHSCVLRFRPSVRLFYSGPAC